MRDRLVIRERNFAIFRDYQNWMQTSGKVRGFYEWAGKKYGIAVSHAKRIVYRRGILAGDLNQTRRKIQTPWTSSFNLYLDHEDGKAYYGERARSTEDKLIVSQVDVDQDIWLCIGDNGQIDPERVKALTEARKQNPGQS